MTDEEFDDALDGMSGAKRKKILRLVSDGETELPREKLPHHIKAGRGCATLLAVMWGIPCMFIGLILIVTVVAAPLGFVMLFVGAWPLYKLTKTWIRQAIDEQE